MSKEARRSRASFRPHGASTSLALGVKWGVFAACLLASWVRANAQTIVTADPPFYGPYNATFLLDGDGLQKPLEKNDSVLRADSPWSLYLWARWTEVSNSETLIAGIGDPDDEYSRYVALDGGHAILWAGKDNNISGPASLPDGKWHFCGPRPSTARPFSFSLTALQ